MRAFLGLSIFLLFQPGCDPTNRGRNSGDAESGAKSRPVVEVAKEPIAARDGKPGEVRPVLLGMVPPGLFPRGSCALEGAKKCERACANGDLAACGAWAALLENGWEVPRDPQQAREVAEQACVRSNSMACGVLGALLAAEGKGPADGEKSARMLFASCQEGDALSCERLGVQRANKKMPGYDAKQATEYYGKACDAGHLRACVAVATLLEDEELSTERNIEALWKRACEAGFAFACSRWARATRQGRYGKADPKLAAQRYDEACRLGHLMSCE